MPRAYSASGTYNVGVSFNSSGIILHLKAKGKDYIHNMTFLLPVKDADGLRDAIEGAINSRDRIWGDTDGS